MSMLRVRGSVSWAVYGATAAAAATAVAVAGSRRFLSTAPRMKSIHRRVPAVKGDLLSAVETPCLLVDLDAMERNLKALPKSLGDNLGRVVIRPHAKAHKCAALAKHQVELSKAIGLCCQKVCEAEAMFAGGVKDLFLSNEIISFERYERMAKLAQQGATITLVFDNTLAIDQADSVARDYNVKFQSLVEINVGQDRCGVDTPEEAVHLAKIIQNECDNLQLRGIQAYHGAAQHIRSYVEKSQVIDSVAQKAQAVKTAFERENLVCDVVTGGGTGTYPLEVASGVFTEIQPGSYLFNDADYSKNLAPDGHFVRDWEQSLFVMTSVMSVNEKAGRAVVDAGTKAVSLDSGPPIVYSTLDATPLLPLEYKGGGDEHGILTPVNATASMSLPMPQLGQKLLLTPGHCDPTANMYDFIVGYRNNHVEDVWELNGRGPGN